MENLNIITKIEDKAVLIGLQVNNQDVDYYCRIGYLKNDDVFEFDSFYYNDDINAFAIHYQLKDINNKITKRVILLSRSVFDNKKSISDVLY
ncbi:hypothetical protein Hokovirus_1_286 [Hokovirus HKV1]|uniref:Uncharacterized protein n=1 Tax=Hokovirus HKV1 TaxID=1977638 RepID=A0A1V0SFB9_9VIRU|nr:hypothetical protein Hokovirus_1_286 [Hokovirus HKV1]